MGFLGKTLDSVFVYKYQEPLRMSWWSSSLSYLSLSSLELSDTKAYEPQIRALLGTASQFCEVVVVKSWCVNPDNDGVLRQDARLGLRAHVPGAAAYVMVWPRPNMARVMWEAQYVGGLWVKGARQRAGERQQVMSWYVNPYGVCHGVSTRAILLFQNMETRSTTHML